MTASSDYRTTVVPDVFLPDGTVRRGCIADIRLRKCLLERRFDVWAMVTKLLKAPIAEKRLFTEDEQFRCDELYAELNVLDARIKRIIS